MLKYIDTPVTEIHDELFLTAGVRVFIKHEELNHPTVAGNKWWKLKYNLERATTLNHDTLLTFGGAFSNHIYSTAAAANELGLKSIGVIRGEETLPLNETLTFAKACGMHLTYVSREAYRTKTQKEFVDQLTAQFGNFYLIPEGGTNTLAVNGCAEFAREKLPSDFDYVCLPVGTGGTISGIIVGLDGAKEIVGISVLKGGEFLKDEIKKLVWDFSQKEYSNWTLQTAYHFGGYGKKTDDLTRFIERMQEKHSIRLDFVYTGKLLAGIYDLIEKGFYKKGSRILMLHTGGLR
ncbi:MAG: 1-aminocyclopropane-1-carboxylate deaminase/D-cysteine desulfhydrase [Bacteroidetes bacterium]|nr:1-aminocyclopropane-1-carboxylate deaminase/D-cysteine desulfhydrase [Bacteroidota bacterium]